MIRPMVLTFDCYGTLVDWETGIRSAFRTLLSRTGKSPELAGKASELYEIEEQKIERQIPHLSYRQVLTRTAVAVARRMGWNLSPKEASALASELPDWRPFPDTNPALERLAKKHELGILSNVDNDLLEGTLRHISVPFAFLVTAENVQSYKPAPAHFERARRIIEDRPWLHVAASQYHDIEPVHLLGINAVWVNRKHLQSVRKFPLDTVWEVSDLLQLADRLHC